MFAQVPAAALADHRLGVIDLRVLAALFSFGSIRKPVCWPRRAAVAERAGYQCLETVSRAIARLRRFGWITRIKRKRDYNIYTLALDPLGITPEVTDPVMSEVTDPVIQNIQTEQTNLPPTPAPAAEPAPVEREKAKIDSEAPESPCEPLVWPGDGNVVGEHENGSESISEALEQARAVIVALIAASGAQYSTKPGSGPMKAAEQALNAGYSVEQIKLVISWCAATWSNPAFLTPSAVLRVSRLDERLAQAQASAPAGQRAQCHRPFKRETPAPRSDPSKVAGHLSRLRAALAA
jgi:hypothetical protein